MEDDLVQVLLDVSSGLAVLHARNFVHLDIKPDNILVSRGPQGCYKIADLGLAAAAMGSGCDDISEGDCRYLAKEVLRGDLTGLPKADVFSLGLVSYELATNPKPLPCNGDEWHVLRTGCFDVTLMPPLREPLLALLHRMVHPTPAERPSCEELSRHPSVAPVDGLEALQEEMRQRTLEAMRNKQLADEYWAELLSMKRQELLNGGLPPQQPVAAGRPVASPVGMAAPPLMRYKTC
jgi:serine/threonine protein kinase